MEKSPGLSIANNQGNIEIYIRGIGSSNNTELGDPAAATHLNGVYIPRPSGFGSAFFDIERVEVNIGPQGTLRGRNATAGSVNVIPWKPWIGNFDSMLEISLGDYDEKRFEGMVNIPTTENSALRIAGFKLTHDSYYNNANPRDATGLGIPTSEAEGIGASEAVDNGAIRASYLVEGLGNWHKLLDPLTVTITYDYLSEQGTGYTGTNYSSVLGAIGRGVNINLDDLDPRNVYVRPITPRLDTVHYGIKGQLDYTTEWFDIEYIASYRDLVYDYQFGGAADTVVYPGALNGYSYNTGIIDDPTTIEDESIAQSDPFDFDTFSRVALITDSKSKIHELRLFSDELVSLPLRWNVGTFYFEEDQRTFLGGVEDGDQFFAGNEFNQRTSTESYSVYSDATYSVSSKFRVTGGVRYTDDHKERTGVNARYAQFIAGYFNSPSFSTAEVPTFPRIGTEGFEFNALGRTIINPDTDGDGQLTQDEFEAFYRDGIASFGDRDTIDDVLSNTTSGLTCTDLIANGTLPNIDCFAVSSITPDFDDSILYHYTNQSSIALQNGQLDNDFIDWRIRSEYDIGDNNLVYGMIATGNKSGGFNDNLPPSMLTEASMNALLNFDATTPVPTYGPETVMLFEFGSKNEFDANLSKLFNGVDIGITFNASGFYYDYSDLQITNLQSSLQIANDFGFDTSSLDTGATIQYADNIVAYTFNASDAEIFGAQFDGGFQFPSDWNFNYTFLWLEAEVINSQEIQDGRFRPTSDFDNCVGVVASGALIPPTNPELCNATERPIEGHRLPRTPRFQLNMSLSKAFPTDWGLFDAILSAGYRSEQHMTIFNGRAYGPLPAGENPERLNDLVDPYWTLDAGAGYSYGNDDALRVELYMTNVTDEQQEQAIIITQDDNTRFFSAPRTYGIRLRMRF